MELPIDQIVAEIKEEPNPQQAYSNILQFGKHALTSSIWQSFEQVDLATDIANAYKWLQKELQRLPIATGIYLSLDTLNMKEGEGMNVEIGFSSNCNPTDMDMNWMFGGDAYGESHLIYSLYKVSDAFVDAKWTYKERSFAEYVVFLGYSGIVLREALLKVIHPQNFLSVWGFHDGDIFYLVQAIGKERRVISDFPID